MSPIACPHCQSENPDGAEFCEQCGKAVPSSTPSGPRVVSGEVIAATSIGQNLQADLLRKAAGKAAGALFIVAGLTVLGGVLLYALGKRLGLSASDLNATLIVNLVLAGIFAALGFWARVNPLPGAIVGLVLFVSILVLNAVLDPASIVAGWLVKIIVVVVLTKAIQAGVKHRQLRGQMPSPDAAP